MKVSVIIPYCQEWPAIVFTLRAVHEELSEIDHEIIAVDNWCEEVEHQVGGKENADQGHARVSKKDGKAHQSHIRLQAALGDKPWLKYVEYHDKLSHWQAKNAAVAASSGDVILSVDAHVVPGRGSLSSALKYFEQHKEEIDGSLHVPLTYHILEDRRLIYALKADADKGTAHYCFSSAPDQRPPHFPAFEVPCMSTCGVIFARETYDLLGGWPRELGIYGGGENFFNFSLAVLGKKKWIFNAGAPLHHHGDKRGYHWNYGDYLRNQTLAAFIYGGHVWAEKFIFNHRDYEQWKKKAGAILDDVFDSGAAHRALIASKQKTTIEEWISRWSTRNC